MFLLLWFFVYSSVGLACGRACLASPTPHRKKIIIPLFPAQAAPSAAENGLLGGAIVDGECDVVNANACNGLQMRDTFFNTTHSFFYSKILSGEKYISCFIFRIAQGSICATFRP